MAIAKGAVFCLPQYIASPAAIIFRELHDEDCLRGLSRDAFVGRLAYYLGEVNALHPFREGNGRAQRAFFAQLARSITGPAGGSYARDPASPAAEHLSLDAVEFCRTLAGRAPAAGLLTTIVPF